MTADALAYLAIGLSVVNAALGIMAFNRAGRWKDSDSASALIGRVAGLEGRCTAIETELRSVATTADVSRLDARLTALGREIGTVERGVERIEQFLMGQPK